MAGGCYVHTMARRLAEAKKRTGRLCWASRAATERQVVLRVTEQGLHQTTTLPSYFAASVAFITEDLFQPHGCVTRRVLSKGGWLQNPLNCTSRLDQRGCQ